MPILTMSSADKDGNYPDGAYSDIYWSRNASSERIMDIVMLEHHVGIVLYTGEVNGYDDSDFYAVIWNDEKGSPERYTYKSTRGWTYPNSATSDATPEILAKYESYQKKLSDDSRRAREAEKFATPDKGKVVEIVSGQKLPVGTKAVVGWYGVDRFNPPGRYGNERTLREFGIYDPEARGQKHGYRVGLKVEGAEKLIFVNATHVKVVGVSAP